MNGWQENFFRESWSKSFWFKNLNHTILHFEGNRDVLLVGFDSEHANQKSKNWCPWGAIYAQANDINYLGLSSDIPDWYQNDWVEKKLTELQEQGFFHRFNRIVFCGHSMGGYAALLYSRMFPGAYTTAFSPQSTLDANAVDFDDRYENAARLQWKDQNDTSKLKYDPAKDFVFYDPRFEVDALHADRLSSDTITKLSCYHAGHGTFIYLNRIGIIDDIFNDLCFGTFTQTKFYDLFRHRRATRWYHQALRTYYEQNERRRMIDLLEEAVQFNKDAFLDSPYQPKAPGIL